MTLGEIKKIKILVLRILIETWYKIALIARVLIIKTQKCYVTCSHYSLFIYYISSKEQITHNFY